MLSLKAGKNKWGYKLNINHPDVAKWYKLFSKQIGSPIYPIGDTERYKFECIMRQAYKRFGTDKKKREEWLNFIIPKIKKLNWERIRDKKNTDKITRLKVLSVLHLKNKKGV